MKTLTRLESAAHTDAGLMAQWAKAVILGNGDTAETVEAAKTTNFRVQRVVESLVTRAATAPMLSTDSDMQGALADLQAISTGFSSLLRNMSIFYAGLEGGGMVRLPMLAKASFLSSAASFSRLGEGQLYSVKRMAFDSVTLDPVKAGGIVVLSEELVRRITEVGVDFINTELRRAIVAAADTLFLDLVDDNDTPTNGSAGISASAAATDMRWLINHAGLTAESRPMLVAAPDVARAASTLFDGAAWTFPTMSPTGGSMVGLPCMVSDAMASATLGLVDFAGIAGNAEPIELASARHALLQLSDTPDSPETATTVPISLWQRNLVGIRPTVFMAAQRLRDTAFVKLTNVSWGSGSDSPA